MLFSNSTRALSSIIFAIFAAVMLSGNVMAGERVDIQRKIAAGSFSRISHQTGLDRAHDRFTGVLQKREYKRGGAAREMLFSKDLSSAASTGFIDAMARQFNTDHGMRRSSFAVTHKNVDPAGNLHIILAQRIDNVKVKVGCVALHFNKEGDLYDISGQIQDDPAIETVPRISGDDAVALGKKVMESESESNGSPELSIVGGRLTYLVMLREKDIPGDWEVTIDARSGEVLEKTNTIRFRDPPGWPSNGYYTPMTGNICTHEGGGSVTVTGWHDNTDGNNYLYNANQHWNIANIEGGYPYSYTSTNWGTTNRPAMNLARNFSRTMAFLSDSMGLNSFNGSGMLAFVLYPGFENLNAFWRPAYLLFEFGAGDGGVTENEWVVLDLVAHECGHAVTTFSPSGGLGNSPEAFALGEGYSDILGACVEEAFQPDGRDQYPFGRRSTQVTSDWLIGEELVVDGGLRWWLRNMREPNVGGNEGNHPSLYKGAYWNADDEPHFNAAPLTFAFYLISEGVGAESVNDPTRQHRYGPFRGLGIGTARKIAWGAQFNGRLPSTADYRAARNAWIATAQELQYDAGVVAQAFAAIGVIDRTVGRPAGANLPTNPPNYTTISAAIAAAATGDLIYVYPGTYTENLTINWPELTIASRNRDLTTIDGSVTIGAYADNTTLTGFTIDASPTTTGIFLNGTSGDNMQGVTISGNTIRNCNTAVSVSYGTMNLIINNKFQSGSGGSTVLANSSYTVITDNKIDGGGIFFNTSNGYNWITYNRWNNVTTDGVRFATANSVNTTFSLNDFVTIGGSDVTSTIALSGLNFYTNAFTNQNGLVLNFPAGTNGTFLQNTYSPNSYSITAPTSLSFNSNYWKDYQGQDTDGDGLGETNIPHAGIDYSPLMIPKARAINFNYNGALLMASTVANGKFRVAGTAGSGTVAGLKFGTNSSLTTGGNLIGSQILINSGRWLDQTANLTGGLVFRDAEGKSQMHVSTGGIVRIRDNLSGGF
jgi:bacillolysin